MITVLFTVSYQKAPEDHIHTSSCFSSTLYFRNRCIYSYLGVPESRSEFKGRKKDPISFAMSSTTPYWDNSDELDVPPIFKNIEYSASSLVANYRYCYGAFSLPVCHSVFIPNERLRRLTHAYELLSPDSSDV